MFCPPPTQGSLSFSTTRAMPHAPMTTRSRGCSASRYHFASWTSRRKASSHACLEADMGLLDLFRRQPPSAQVAKERLRIIVAQERSARGGPDYLPLLRRELLEVIRKYVNVDPEAVVINLERDQGQEVLELTVALPDKIQGAKKAAGAKT